MSDEKQLSLDDAIEAALNNPTPEPDPVEEVTETQEASDARARDEKGRFAAKEIETPTEAPVVATEVASPVESTETKAHETQPEPKIEVSEGHFRGWNPEQKAKFQALPPEAQDVVLALKRDTDSHYTRKLEDAATFRKTAEPTLQALNKHADLFAAQNMTPVEAYEGYANIERALTYGTFAEKVDLIGKICHRYAIPFAPSAALDQLDPNEAQMYPALHDRDAEIARERAEKAQLQARLQQIQAQTFTQSIESFQSATNADGTPKHPYFEDVKMFMGTLLQSGKAQTLDDAYAIATAPIVRSIEAAKAAERSAMESRNRETVEKAKRAAPVKASAAAPNGKPIGKQNLDDVLDQALSQHFQ